ncbi:MAG: hypothetical protein OEX07_00870 [Gammaproteobacteria bacterium]|nr:hypothetical protein [Gammaproteobacteria bacterium]
MAPLYQKQDEWVKVMKNLSCKDASYFSSHRMMRRYATETYVHQVRKLVDHSSVDCSTHYPRLFSSFGFRIFIIN